jgi:hypothetical protein
VSACADEAYLRMRLARTRIAAGPNPDWQGEQISVHCAKLVPK